MAAAGAAYEVFPINSEAPTQKGTVLLLGNYRVSLVIARQLGRAGYGVIAGDTAGSLMGSCKYVDGLWDHPSLYKNSQVFLEGLNELLEERPDVFCILPVSEPILLRMVKMVGQLPIPLAAVDRGNVETCCDKGRMADIATELKVPQAPALVAESMEELINAADQVGYPCVVKPNDGRNYGVKAYFLDDPQHLLHQFPEWPGRHDSLLVQAYATGPRFNRYFVADKGKIIDSLDVKILRTDRPDGSGYAVEGVSIDPLREMDEPSNRLLERLDYTGVGCLQFLFDEQRRQLCFLEINPRIGGNYAFAHSCGLDLVSPLLAMARGETLTPGPDAGRHARNRRYIWLYGDMIGLMGSLYKRELGVRGAAVWAFRIGTGLLRADTHLTYDRQDRGPSMWFARRLGEAALVMMIDFVRFLKRRVSALVRI